MRARLVITLGSLTLLALAGLRLLDLRDDPERQRAAADDERPARATERQVSGSPAEQRVGRRRDQAADEVEPRHAEAREAFTRALEARLEHWRGLGSPPDFADEIANGHEPSAIRQLASSFQEFVAHSDNELAEVQFLGTDCTRAPCLMAVEFNTDQDDAFRGRALGWLTKSAGLGDAQMIMHRLDANHQRVWYYFNPEAPGTREYHAYEESVRERFLEEREHLPDYNPSRDLAARSPTQGAGR